MKKSIIYIFLSLSLVSFNVQTKHPFFVSIIEVTKPNIEDNIEISIKLFTDDFEQILRKENPSQKIDIYHNADKILMKNLMLKYIKKHFEVKLNAQIYNYEFVGYEPEKNATIVYFEIPYKTKISKLNITNNLLYDFKKEQTSIVHMRLYNNRVTKKQVNPEDQFLFDL